MYTKKKNRPKSIECNNNDFYNTILYIGACATKTYHLQTVFVQDAKAYYHENRTGEGKK